MATIVNSFQTLTIVTMLSISDVCRDLGYAKKIKISENKLTSKNLKTVSFQSLRTKKLQKKKKPRIPFDSSLLNVCNSLFSYKKSITSLMA